MKEEPPSLVPLDIALPEEDGADKPAAFARFQPQNSAVIMLTAKTPSMTGYRARQRR